MTKEERMKLELIKCLIYQLLRNENTSLISQILVRSGYQELVTKIISDYKKRHCKKWRQAWAYEGCRGLYKIAHYYCRNNGEDKEKTI